MAKAVERRLTPRQDKEAIEANEKQLAIADQRRREERRANQELETLRERSNNRIGVLIERDFDEILGGNWRNEKPTKIDLSAEKFKLETLIGNEPFRGLMNAELFRKKITYIDISDNRLRDISILTEGNDFISLNVLIARRNMISSPNLVLSKLMELNLAYNEMKILPVLAGMPLLEVLIVSHNQMEGTFDKLQSCKRLRRIDLAFNNFRISPGQLTSSLEALSMLHNLTHLRLMENPFVAYIKEYQIFTLKKLKELKCLDDIPITANIRSELDNYNKLYSLDTYNDIFDERKEELEKQEYEQQNKTASGPKMSQMPQFVNMVLLLDEVLDDSSTLLRNIGMFRADAGHMVDLFSQVLSSVNPEEEQEENRVETDFWSGFKDRFKSEDLAVSHFLELVLNCMERHDSVRTQLIESLGCLSCMSMYRFGVKCMQTLGTLMTSSESGKGEVIASLNTVIIKNLDHFTNQDMNTAHCQAIVEGLVQMMQNPTINADVAITVTPLMERLVSYFLMRSAQEAKYCIKLLAFATAHEENCAQVAKKEFVDKLIVTLENPTIAEDMGMRGLWLDTLKLAENLAKYGPDEIYVTLEKANIHVRLITKLKSTRSQGLHVGKTKLADDNARTLQKVLQFLYGMMKRNGELLHSCCTGYHLVRELTELVKEHRCKAFILSEAVRMVILVLKDNAMCKLYIATIVKELSKLKPCLQYLGQKKYNDLFEEGQVRPLVALEPLHDANGVLIQMLGIIEFFADTSDGGDEDEGQKDLVNRYLNDEGREKHVLDLLVVPNEDVKFAVLSCISKVPVDQIEEEEMGLLVKFLSDSKNIGAGKMEEILAAAIKQLERLADGQGHTHEEFRKSKCDEALSKIYDILLVNARRDTFDNVGEEQEKLALSTACVSFFGACSKYPQLHEYMRSAHIYSSLYKILKFEEARHKPRGPCVAIEQTWPGRSIDNLMNCFQPGKETLVRDKKVAFRVMARIADIFEGRTDTLRKRTEGYTLKEVCGREAIMWPPGGADKYLRLLNDPEWKDREFMVTKFAESDGVTRIINYLSHTKTIEREVVYQKQLDEAGDQSWSIQNQGKHALKDIEEGEQGQRDAEEELEVPLDELDEEVGYETGSGLKALMSAAQSCEDTVDEDDDAIFVTPPQNFDISELDENGEVHFTDDGRINHAYILSAAFRAISALIRDGPNHFCRSQAITTMRDPKVIKRLMALVEGQSYLTCNLAAKLLHMMILVLEVGVFGNQHPGSRLEICALISTFTSKISAGMVKLLRLTKDKRLNEHQQTLCVEIARYFAMVTRVIPFFRDSVFTMRKEVQAECITKSLDWLIPRDGLRLSIAMILYELQVDAGAGIGKDIGRNYVLESYKKQEMKERATHFLAHYIIRCPEKKYDILEVFNVAEVFQRMQVRPSYMRDLLNEANMGNFLLHCEDWIHGGETECKAWTENPTERITQVAVCKAMSLDPRPKLTTCIICTGVAEVWLLAPDQSAPPYKNDQAGAEWDPSWELVFPREPSVIWAKQLKDIECLYRLFGPQMLGIDWVEEEGQAAGVAAKLFGKKKKGVGTCTPIIFERARDRARIMRSLQRSAGKSATKSMASADAGSEKNEKRTLPIVNDAAVKVPVMKEVGDLKKWEILMATVAMSITAGEPRMFVLTTEKVIDFRIDMGAWLPPDLSKTDTRDEPFLPKDVLREVRHTPGGDKAPNEAETLAAMKDHLNRTVQGGQSKDEGDAPESCFFTKDDDYRLPPKEITFDDTSECPDLLLEFQKGPVKIRFFDDTGREDWRRALSYYLAFKDKQSWARNN